MVTSFNLRHLGRPMALAVALALTLALALSGGPAAASVVDLFGYGARGAALAGAIVSHPTGHAAVYYNPAALAFESAPSFSIGFQRGDLLLDVNGNPFDAQAIPALVLGFGAPIPMGGWMERRLTLGLGFVLPQTSILIADLPRPGTESFVLLENRAQTVSLQGALGLRLTDSVSVGVGFIALAALIGQIDVAPNDEGQIGSQVKDEVIADYATIAGVLFRPLDGLALAATFHDESRAEFAIPITADLGDQFTLPIPPLNLAGIAQYDPRQATLEASARPIPALALSLGVTWKQWSAFKNPIEYTAVPVDFPAQPDPRFKDTFSPRLGVEYTHDLDPDLRLTPRLGLAFEPTPAPEQTGDQNYLDNNRVVVGLGFEVGWQTLSLAVVGQWHHLLPRTSVKDPALLNDAILEDNPGAPSITHSGDILFWGVELGLEL